MITQQLQQHFGFDSFRVGQEQVINCVMSGRSAAAIFPTGSGKSLCYQLPAVCLPHLTLVVSPLLALIQDQLAFLKAKGIPAASIDSGQERHLVQQTMNQVRQGKIKILMISVERFNNERFREFICQVPISLLVVDEAHCISEWGHNFRPDYLKLPQYQRALNVPQTLLLTATATSRVIKDMADKFSIAPNDVTVTGFYRPNLNLNVIGVKEEDKCSHLIAWLQQRQDLSGIIYVTLQQSSERLANALNQAGIRAEAYHAGMDTDTRRSIQKRFMTGEHQIIVATIAFGMGVDKPDIRFVVHYDLPKSIENYAQEIGRAGRDGLASDCLVLANTDNLNVLQNFVYGDTPDRQGIVSILTQIRAAQVESSSWEVMLHRLSTQSNVRLLSLKTLLVYLEMAGIITPSYSYFAEYRFKLLITETELIGRFTGERQTFVEALLKSATKAKLWYSLDFEQLNQHYPSERSRMVAAIDYFEQQGVIALETKQMTHVYQLPENSWDLDATADSLYQQFVLKERSEIERIQATIDMLASTQCLTRRLSAYFNERQQGDCGHCSVCLGAPAQLPSPRPLKPLAEKDFLGLCQPLAKQLAGHLDANLLARALCGLTTPLFTRLRLRNVSGFGQLESYRFDTVRQWCQQHLNHTDL